MLASRVLPAFALVRASRMPVSALMSVDLPTFERPTSATCGTPSRGVSSPRAALVTNSAPATLMRHPFFRPGWGTNVVGMVLEDDVDWSEVAELLVESYCVLAPKKLVALVDRPSPDGPDG